jgi:hypothetical protein
LVENGCFRAVAFANAALGVVGLGLGMDLGMDLPATENAGKVRTNELPSACRSRQALATGVRGCMCPEVSGTQ